MQTERLYYNDAYIKNFTAKIVKTAPYCEKHCLVLDRTAFYPEGGGQPSDMGHIDGIPVLFVTEEDGQICHIVESLPAGTAVECSIDWERRFDHMQQHTGQHILSACFASLYNGDTDSFHLGRDNVSIEINIDRFDEEMAVRIEDMANEMALKNLPVFAKIVDDEELQTMPLRKKPKVTDNIRIVQIQGFDYSPCGGTHVSNTGEVGMIRLKKWERCKGGYRFQFVCGSRALADYRLQDSITRRLGDKLSVRDFEIESAFEKLLADYKSVQKELLSAKQELLAYEADRLMKESGDIRGIHVVSRVFEDRNINDVKLLAQSIIRQPGYAALFVCKNEAVQVIFSRSDDVDLDMGKLIKTVFPIINGKGGGNAKAAQGGGSNTDAAQEFLAAALSEIEKA